jgi:heme/copper-type cytochrome/quinol oxidase subunit 2
MTSRARLFVSLGVLCALLGVLGTLGGLSASQEQGPSTRPFKVTAKRYKFDPARIEVTQDDLIAIELSTEDIAHSFTLDAYRIDKRATPGHPVTFEFRADKTGTFTFYCDLKTEEGCRTMKGELVVKPRK